MTQRVVEAAHWNKKRGKLPAGRGIGLAGYSFSSGGLLHNFPRELPYSDAQVRIDRDGTAHLITLANDIGQGSNSVLTQIAAEELGLNYEDIKLTVGDTDVCGPDVGTFSSRVTMFAGNAVKDAAADAKRQLFEFAAEKLGVKSVELVARGGRIFVKASPEKGMSHAEAACAALEARGGMSIIGRGVYAHQGGFGGTPAVSFGTQAVEVEVDKETGEVRVHRVTVAHDCGRALNPMTVEGQLEGSIHMGLGFALTEDLLVDEKGAILNPSLKDYRLFRAPDMPEIEAMEVETDDPNGPFGAKEAGEGLVLPTAPAVADAIYDAIGVRVNSLPITPEKVLKALAEKEGQPTR